MGEPNHGLRYFSGDDTVDWREYKRWKQWCINKMAVMDKLPKTARGSFVWTLLQGRALEVVEHLKEEEYQKEDGDKVIFGLLDTRWPERDRTDEIGEHITEVFHLRAKEGELLRTWCARARECFDRCQRKTGVSFPEEAKGWILLHCGGMSEEQRAVVLARTDGVLKFDVLSTAMRSCFPEFVVPKKKTVAAHYVENEDAEWWYQENHLGEPSYEDDVPAGDETAFHDVELFLTEHDQDTAVEGETFQENEVAEVLAATWRDKRQELARLQKARKFHQAGDVRRSFRVEVEELKKRTQCRHWARECKSKLPPKPAGSEAAGGAFRPTSSASMVQHFVCHAVVDISAKPKTLLDSLRALRLRRAREADRPDEPDGGELLLVSSPGFAVLDSGCGRSVVGEETLAEFRSLWSKAGVGQPPEIAEVNVFKFGNGAQETSRVVVEMPVSLAGRRGVVRAALIRGKAPLLLSRAALKTLKANMDFAKDELCIFEGDQRLPMHTNRAGQYIIPVADFSTEVPEKHSTEVPEKQSNHVEIGAALAEPVAEVKR